MDLVLIFNQDALTLFGNQLSKYNELWPIKDFIFGVLDLADFGLYWFCTLLIFNSTLEYHYSNRFVRSDVIATSALACLNNLSTALFPASSLSIKALYTVFFWTASL